ncbi:MAG TPA: DUF5666 domain-containing protein [Albitalea sp.]|jgi:hypothetical protein|nr:DUF5666 domain-containing protein [Albitalea sp.]
MSPSCVAHPLPILRRLAALLLATLVAACGGGVDTGGTGAPTQSYSSGRISGFGSIVVNGVHFDESDASIVDDDGATHHRSELRLGMTVDVQAGPIAADAGTGVLRSAASRIEFGSEIKGPVERVDVAAGTLRVLGQSLMVDVNTVFDGYASGLAGVQPSQLVEVFAFFDPASGVYTATRIERESALSAYKLRGPIANLDTGAKTFAIGGASISYAGITAAALPGLANGTTARVQLQTAQQAGRWVATRIRTGLPGIADGLDAEVEGYVTDFASLADFKVRGVSVDASGAGVVFVKGGAAQIVNGARIEVEGHMQAGMLVATKVEVKKKRGGNDEDEQEFEFDGTIDSVDLTGKSFVVRDTVITFDAATTFSRGSADDLRVGARVEVKGVLAGGQQVRAKKIKFES